MVVAKNVHRGSCSFEWVWNSRVNQQFATHTPGLQITQGSSCHVYRPWAPKWEFLEIVAFSGGVTIMIGSMLRPLWKPLSIGILYLLGALGIRGASDGNTPHHQRVYRCQTDTDLLILVCFWSSLDGSKYQANENSEFPQNKSYGSRYSFFWYLDPLGI